MNIVHNWRFLRQFLRRPKVIGAVAPSSRALATAVCGPYRRAAGSVRLLEVGAGTGSITRHIGTILGSDDRLDLCEIYPELASVLARDVLTNGDFAPAVADGRVRLLNMPVQEIDEPNGYDFVISGLPLTSFDLESVRSILEVIRRALKPGGVFSYFEYIALRPLSRTCAVGRRRARIRGVSAFLTRHIRDHQFSRQTVLANFPPAHARHFRYDEATESPASLCA